MTAFVDYGYRAWSNVQTGDYVTFGADPRFVRVVNVEPIPAENTATGTADHVRVTGEHDDGRRFTFAIHGYRHTTVYYRRGGDLMTTRTEPRCTCPYYCHVHPRGMVAVVDCPECEGSGQVRHPLWGSRNCPDPTVECPVCGGTGEIDDDDEPSREFTYRRLASGVDAIVDSTGLVVAFVTVADVADVADGLRALAIEVRGGKVGR